MLKEKVMRDRFTDHDKTEQPDQHHHHQAGRSIPGDPATGQPLHEFDLWGDVQPEFRAVHDLDARLPEECLWLMAPQFDLGFWATNVDVPSWMAYRAFTDPAPTYAMHRAFVQVLQGGAPTSWLFKSPVHLGRLPALLAEYPDARIIRTHRDPLSHQAGPRPASGRIRE